MLHCPPAACRRGAPYNTTTGAPGLNPCLDAPVSGADGTNFGTYQEYLVRGGAGRQHGGLDALLYAV